MELQKIEFSVLEEAAVNAVEGMFELDNLQLALVGGGIGETVLV